MFIIGDEVVFTLKEERTPKGIGIVLDRFKTKGGIDYYKVEFEEGGVVVCVDENIKHANLQ